MILNHLKVEHEDGEEEEGRVAHRQTGEERREAITELWEVNWKLEIQKLRSAKRLVGGCEKCLLVIIYPMPS